MKKRFFSLVLALTMCLGLAVPALAADAGEELPTREEAESMYGLFTDMEVSSPSDMLVREKVTVYGTDLLGNKDTEISASSYWNVSRDVCFYIVNRSGRDDCTVCADVRLYENDGTGIYREVEGWSGGSRDEQDQLIGIPNEMVLRLNVNNKSDFYGTKDAFVRIMPMVAFQTAEGASTAYGYDAYFFRIGMVDRQGNPSASDVSVTTTPGGITIRKNPTATPTSATVLVNGENVAFDAYNIDGANYFKLRDLAFVLSGTEKQFEVSYDTATKNIALLSGQTYTAVGGELAASSVTGAQSASTTPSTILLDGEEISLTAYLINGSNYFMLRDIGQLFDFGIGWDADSRTITIDTSTGYTAG